jgi:predicted O-methyltransferase YrrM
MGGGDLTVAEIDLGRAAQINSRLDALDLPNTTWAVLATDVMQVIASLPDKWIDMVWLDDDHEEFHVRSEITALWPKVKPGGLIVGHDVFGSVNLQKVFKHFGGLALDLPRLGPAGGIGIIQIPK